MSIPTVEPSSIVQGETLTFTKSLSDYLPADSWVLSYALVNASGQITFTASDNGDGTHLVDEAPATTAAYTVGTYKYQAKVTGGTDVFLVGEGSIEVETSFAAASSGYDDRSHVKKVLDALEATILGKASSDQLSYSIGNRSLSKMSPAELLDWRSRYEQEYQRELAAEKVNNGLASGDKILVRF